MFVVIDANVVMSDPHLRAATWEGLAEAGRSNRVRVFMPTIAMDEAVAGYKTARDLIARKTRTESRLMMTQAKTLVAAALQLTREEANRYGAYISDRWSGFGFETCPPPTAEHRMVAARAIARRRPFNGNGGGYRDTLHWLSVLDLISMHPDEDVVLLSSDATFADGDGGLHPDLLEDAAALLGAGSIALVRNLSDLIVPGEWRDREASVFKPSLIDALVDNISDSSVLEAVPPEQLGIIGAEWIDGVEPQPNSIEVVDIEARERFDGSSTEVQFIIDLIASVAVTSVLGESGEPGGPRTACVVRKLRFEGRAKAYAPASSVDLLLELSVELYHEPGWKLAELGVGIGSPSFMAASVDDGEPPSIRLLHSYP